MEDVVQELDLPPALPDLAGGELSVSEVVGAVEGKVRGAGEEL